MYLQFYGLKEQPFTMSPDPKYIYYTPVHKEALAQMTYAVRHNSSFMVLSGEVGTGKTSLINALRKTLPDKYHVVVIAHAIFDPEGLIKSVCRGFGIRIRDISVQDLLFELQDHLDSLHMQGKKPVLIFDEAQLLTAEILEHIRLLSNFETESEKILRIILVGQPELIDRLRVEELRALAERVNLRYDLRPLTPVETGEYVIYRLEVAGFPAGYKLFSERVLELIYKFSDGVPRRINIYADRTLMLGYARNMKYIE